MKQRRTGLWISTILALSACNAIVGVEDVEVVPGTGGTGGAGGSAGAGGMGSSSSSSGSMAECTVDMDCAVMDPNCQKAVCESGTCKVSNLQDGTDCLQTGQCTSGVCLGKNGTSCGGNNECAGNFCVDGVCCATECSAQCYTCDLAGQVGTCMAVPRGQDDPSFACGANEACDGSGSCKRVVGQACATGSDCVLGNCVDGYCCDTACDGTCEACNLPGAMGTCTPLPVNADDPGPNGICTDNKACDGAGACKLKNARVCATDAECLSGLCMNGLCSAQSCIGLPENCGPNQNGNCCVSPTMPGGPVERAHGTVYRAEVGRFALDKYEVTIGRFRKFLAAYDEVGGSKPEPGDGAHPRVPGSGWNGGWPIAADAATMNSVVGNCDGHTPTAWTNQPGPNENLPMACVSWHEAFAFCAWDGGRLPTEAEWVYAAANGEQQRFYPWSTPPNSQTISYDYGVYNCGAQLPDGLNPSSNCALADILPVGSKPMGNGAFGHSDLGGNMFEWVADEYIFQQLPVPCVDCIGNGPTDDHVIRGGSWNNTDYSLRNDQRSGVGGGIAKRTQAVGFRCARDPAPICGNGVIDAGEFCDDNSANSSEKSGCKKCDKVKKVVAGESHACAVTQLGKLKCWGDNRYGQLGQGVAAPSINNPAAWPAIPLPKVIDVALGEGRTCALLDGGIVRCFGADNLEGAMPPVIGATGMLGTPLVVNGPVGDQFGEVKNGANVGLAAKAVAITSGRYHTCALLEGGAVQCWGSNQAGRLGVGDTMPKQGPAQAVFSPGVVASSISAAWDSTCAILANGDIACWGADRWGTDGGGMGLYGTLGLNTTAHDARGDAPGEMLGGLLKTVLPMGLGTPGVISGGGHGYCVVHGAASKTVRCWGWNARGQLGRGTRDHWGAMQFGTNMTQLTAINLGMGFLPSLVAAGRSHTCVFAQNGSLKCFGSNQRGELGLGLPAADDVTDFGIGDAPGEVDGALASVDLGTDAIKQLSAGNMFTCALFQNDKVKCWGNNDYGQTGIPGAGAIVGDELAEVVADLPYVEPF